MILLDWITYFNLKIMHLENIWIQFFSKYMETMSKTIFIRYPIDKLGERIFQATVTVSNITRFVCKFERSTRTLNKTNCLTTPSPNIKILFTVYLPER